MFCILKYIRLKILFEDRKKIETRGYRKIERIKRWSTATNAGKFTSNQLNLVGVANIFRQTEHN